MILDVLDYVVVDSEVILFFLFVDLHRHPVEGFSAGLGEDENIYRWEVMIMGPQETV